MRELCNIDGRIVPLQDATVPVMDRGFLFGDSVYEVMRTHAGVPFAWPEHLARLRASAAGLYLAGFPADAAILRQMRRTLEAAGVGTEPDQAYIRVIVTRGRATTPSIDLAQAQGPCSCILIVRGVPPPPPSGIRVVVVDRLRTDRRALDPALKTGNYLNSVLGLAEAKARGGDDCIMLSSNGFVTEASTSNVFAVSGGRVRTPPVSAGILAGVTRGLLLELCRRLDVVVEEVDLTATDLRCADELFLSSTLRDVLPVSAIDGQPIRNGNPVTAKLCAAFPGFAAELTRLRYGPGWQREASRDEH